MNIKNVSFEKEMQDSYLSYAISVVTARAVPDARDGQKPVQRRILWSMRSMGLTHEKLPRKSARVTGDVMGKYHPHGNAAIYDAMIRMTQDFSMRMPMVECQGNNGSIDGDKPAQERYTEVRLTQAGEATLRDIDEGVIDFVLNYDRSYKEPSVLPVPYPALLINGGCGIAVGMSTNIPTHNTTEVMKATIALLKNPDMSLDEIVEILPAPDFPTGGILSPGRSLYEAYKTGKGSVYLRGECEVKDNQIIITSVPYQVNKAKLVERIGELIKEKTIENVSDLRDESDRDGVRVVLDLKRDACGGSIQNQLYMLTNLQVNVSIQMYAIVKGRPKQMGLLELLRIFLDFREEVIIRRTNFRLNKAQEKIHILAGLALALDKIDEIIKVIRGSSDAQEAKRKLCSMEFERNNQVSELLGGKDINKLSEVQASSVLNLKLQKLTKLEKNQLIDELKSLVTKSQNLSKILEDRGYRLDLLKQELEETHSLIKSKRKTKIEYFDSSPLKESMIPKENMIVTINDNGYIKRIPLDAYNTQHRGGKGKSFTKETTSNVFGAHTLQEVLFFSKSGKVYSKKVYELPVGTAQSKGKSLLSLIAEQDISAIVALPESSDATLIFATKYGKIRKNKLSDFQNIRANGKIAIQLSGGDNLISVSLAKETSDVIIATRAAKLMKFPNSELRVMSSRQSSGVKGIELDEKDYVVAAHAIDAGTDLLAVSENGYGKRTSANFYRTSKRGGKGTFTFDISEKTGSVVTVLPVSDDEDVIIMTNDGQTIRIHADQIRKTNRRAQGVQLIKAKSMITRVIATLQ